MATPIRLLIIDDDVELLDTLCIYFRCRGMDVRGITDGSQLGRAVEDVDIVICDINLPGDSGFALMARLRLTSRIGIIALTGRSQQEDRLLGLSIGADHWMTKPVSFGELELLIGNLHRRLQEAGQTAPAEPAQAQECWQFDTTPWMLTAPNGRSVQLTQAEYRFIDCLLASAGRPVSREQLLEGLGRPNLDGYRRNLDVTLSRLRRKVEDACGEKLPVQSARGTGYVFTGRCLSVS